MFIDIRIDNPHERANAAEPSSGQLQPGQYDVAFADPPYASAQAALLVAVFRMTPFARVFSIEHPADQPIPGDDTRRYGDTGVTFIYAP